MHKSILFFAFLVISLNIHAEDVIWNGKVYDDDTVANLVTIITTTNPINSIPETTHIYPSQVSLCRIPALAKCKKIIVFDGLQPWFAERAADWEAYKNNIIELTKTDPCFSNTQLIFCEEWVHLAGTIKEAIKHVTTPYIFIHQHDDILVKDFDANGVIASMEANPNLKHVRLRRKRNQTTNGWNGIVDTVIDGPHFVPLCRTFGWSDYEHFARVEYYTDFILPQCGHVAMENIIHYQMKRDLADFGIEAHQLYGTYLYGDIDDGRYFSHSNGRKDPT